MEPLSRQSPKCSLCGSEISLIEARAGGICRSWRCRETALARAVDGEKRRAAQRLSDRTDPEATSVRREVVRSDVSGRESPAPNSAFVEHATSALSVVVAWIPFRFSALPKTRKAAFLSHLDALLEAAQGSMEPASSASGRPGDIGNPMRRDSSDSNEVGAPGSILGNVCAACQGSCCRAGGTHAFLDAARVREILAQHGNADDVRAAYESRFPETSVRGSCVFHGAAGCRLPRGLRGGLCNRFECPGLEEARRETEDGAALLHVVRRAEQKIHDSAFVTADAVARVRRGTARSRGAAPGRDTAPPNGAAPSHGTAPPRAVAPPCGTACPPHGAHEPGREPS